MNEDEGTQCLFLINILFHFIPGIRLNVYLIMVCVIYNLQVPGALHLDHTSGFSWPDLLIIQEFGLKLQ